VRREAYQFIGGHGAVRQFLVDDVKLAALALRHRLKLATVRAGRLGHARFHAEGIRRGVERHAFRFMEVHAAMAFVSMAAATLAALWLPLAAWLWWNGDRAYAGTLLLLPLLWMAGWYRGWRLILAPAAIYALLPWLCRGMLSAVTAGRIQWKGRTI
jgi:hypothetical protein